MAHAPAKERPHYLARLWAEFGRMGGEHDAFTKVIIVERIAKSVVRHITLFKVGALLLNVAVVGYLAYRKRLFVGI
jgi:hypothetical protein